MRRECKELLKQNNKREKIINKFNIDIYTQMIVYMRESDIDEYTQELIRADLIEMIIDGQERGDDIKKVMGGNYKEICDEIINTFSKKSKKQRLMEILNTSLSSIWILGGISVIQTLIFDFSKEDKMHNYELSLGNLLSIIILTVIANIIIKYLCKNSFDSLNKNKTIEFLKVWIIAMIIIGSCLALSYYLDYVLIKVSIIYAIIFIIIVFCLERIVDSKI
ncbi:Protein of uncharacterised function (DUF1129) [uncultured Clostridium sp.]|uniref:hypothetical protein n=1 Tax=uncultured Clostridium sp. TaxID=59620 RepID=UPI0008211CC9|nr:hypothetical protein [uncultured Clostridium sp.]SCK03373.1 Protein of uncharacterised function (DUF1129) [uncultured Clostridium sp.]